MDGLKLIAKYALPPNRLGYCGKESATQAFSNYILKESNAKAVKEEIKKFQGLYAYLDVISKATKQPAFSYEVGEAYFIGNKLLDKIDRDYVIQLIRKLQERGLPESIAHKKIFDLPKRQLYLHHSFNVLYIGVGNVTGSVSFTVENINNCLVLPAKVIKIKKDKVEVLVSFLDEDLEWKSPEKKEVAYTKEFIPNLKEGNIVSIHWNQAVDILKPKQAENLKHYTEENLNIVKSL